MRSLRLIIFIVAVCSGEMIYSADYYFSHHGDDRNSGTSDVESWRTLSSLRNITLKPGDRILLRAGSKFKGSVSISTQGRPNAPIVITRYGEGPRPLIDGDGAEAAITLFNPAYITISGLEIINWEGVFGIKFQAEDAGEMPELHFEDLDVHDVGKKTFENTEPSKSIGGICGRVNKGTRPSWWNGLTFRNIYVHNVGSCGITFGNDVNLYKMSEDDPYYKPHLNVKIEHCRIDSIVRDGIWIRQCKGAVIRNCEVSRTGLNAVSNGMWFWDCLESVMEFNEGWECLSPRGNDGAPFSIDNHCISCVMQYNYSHDNEGPGYMVFGRMGDGRGNIVRNNLSYNDNVTKTYREGLGSIGIVSEVKDARIENNIIIAGPDTHSVLGHRDWEGYPVSVTYIDNLFVGNGKAFVDPHVKPAGDFQGNFFINIPGLPEGLQNQTDVSNYYGQMLRLQETMKRISGK